MTDTTYPVRFLSQLRAFALAIVVLLAAFCVAGFGQEQDKAAPGKAASHEAGQGKFAASKGAPARAPRYKLIELPLRPLAISDSGFVAGTTSDQKVAAWSAREGLGKDALQRIELPAEYPVAEATAVNRHGDAVGTAYAADSSRHIAFLFRQHKVLILAGEQSQAFGINDAGTIVGQSIPPGAKATEPVLWANPTAANNSAPEPLHICCAGKAKAINQRGHIIGDTYDAAGRYHAFLWSAESGNAGHGSGKPGNAGHETAEAGTAGRGMTGRGNADQGNAASRGTRNSSLGQARRLDLPDEQFSSAIALNDVGQVVLRSDPAGFFLYQAGKRLKLDLPRSQPLAINNHGVMVGSFGPNSDKQLAFVWDKAHGRRNLNDLIAPDSGWTLEVASGINDRGEIIGWGDHSGTDNAGFLLIPQ